MKSLPIAVFYNVFLVRSFLHSESVLLFFLQPVRRIIMVHCC